MYAASGRDINFGQQGNHRMRITSSGNVGIGITTPSSALAVNGAVTSGNILGDSNATVVDGPTFGQADGGTIELVSGGTGTGSGVVCTITWAPSSWKSFVAEISAASTSGYYHGVGGGYNNNGGSGGFTKLAGHSAFGVAASSSGQSISWAVTMAGTHPFIKIKLSNAGGAGVPLASQFTFTWA